MSDFSDNSKLQELLLQLRDKKKKIKPLDKSGEKYLWVIPKFKTDPEKFVEACLSANNPEYVDMLILKNIESTHSKLDHVRIALISSVMVTGPKLRDHICHTLHTTYSWLTKKEKKEIDAMANQLDVPIPKPRGVMQGFFDMLGGKAGNLRKNAIKCVDMTVDNGTPMSV